MMIGPLRYPLRVAFGFVLVALASPFASGQCATGKIVPVDAACGQYFGHTMAFDGGILAVSTGTPRRVHVFEQVADGWNELQTISEAGTGPGYWGDQYANSIAVWEDWLAIGTPSDDALGLDQSGVVHVYKRSGDTWNLHQRLVDSQAKAIGRFGWTLAADDGVLAVTAYGSHPHVARGDKGSVIIYQLQAGVWLESARLKERDPAGRFGESLALHGTRLVVGTPELTQFEGVAYVFDRVDGEWTASGTLRADIWPVSGFGRAVAVEAERILVSSYPTVPSNFLRGVFVFERHNDEWMQVQKLDPGDPVGFLAVVYFGTGLALRGDDLIIGASGYSDLGQASGACYHFRRMDGVWQQVGKLLDPEGGPLHAMGTQVVLWRNRVLASAVGRDDSSPSDPGCNSGAVVEFTLASDAVSYGSCLDQGPCGNHDGHGGCINSTGQGAVLQACGSGSVAADDMCMEARWLAFGQPTVLFMGGAAVSTPFGDGLLNVRPGLVGLFRFPVVDSGTQGVVEYGPGIVGLSWTHNPTAGQIQPGDTWYFQAWYRDPNGPCGTGANLTNGVKADFKP
jgi:hypothetical protein